MGVIQNYIKAHAFKLIARQGEGGIYFGETEFSELKLPIEAEIEAQKLADQVMQKVNKYQEASINPFEKICSHWDYNGDIFNGGFVVPFIKE